MKSSDVTAGNRVAAITLREPWATLMALGAKKNETRSWPTRHRGALLICAAQRKNKGEMADLLGRVVSDGTAGPFAQALAGVEMSYGHAVALVDVDRCAEIDIDKFKREPFPLDGDEISFGDYSPGRFAWVTSGLRRLEPFPVTGRQVIFYVTMPHGFEDWSASWPTT